MYCIQKKGRKSMKYVVPELEIVKLDMYDVICASGDGDGMNEFEEGGAGGDSDGDMDGSGGW